MVEAVCLRINNSSVISNGSGVSPVVRSIYPCGVGAVRNVLLLLTLNSIIESVQPKSIIRYGLGDESE
jgi:hypothetical protein